MLPWECSRGARAIRDVHHEQRARGSETQKGKPSQMVDLMSHGTVSLYREGKIIARSAVVVGLDGDAAARQNLAIGQVGKGAHDRIR